MSRSKSKHEEALQLLDDLDSIAPSSRSTKAAPAPAANKEGEAEVLAFLDEITQRSAEPTRMTNATHLERPLSRSNTPTLRKSGERVKLGASPLLPSNSTGSIGQSSSVGPDQPTAVRGPPIDIGSKAGISSSSSVSGGPAWGWGSVWSSATAALQQARSAVDEQVRSIPNNEQARKLGEGIISYAKNAQLDKLGQDFKRVGLSTLTDILNVVAPPISEHEVIYIWLSHDMKGYEGVESLVYRAMTRIMEQVEGGDLIVNRGEESKPKGDEKGERDLNVVEGYEAALKLAQANIEELIKKKVAQSTPKPTPTETATTYSYVYLRIQPFLSSQLVLAPPGLETGRFTNERRDQQSLQFLLHLVDPNHQLSHITTTQPIPAHWLDVWDKFYWVEDAVAECIRVGIEVLGQEYVVHRMSWSKVVDKTDEDKEAGEDGGNGKDEDEDGGESEERTADTSTTTETKRKT